MSTNRPKYKHAVMLVDDEPGITKAIQRILRREKLDTIVAADGPSALELLKNRDKMISLIISDQRMPKMTGAQFLEKARAIVPDAIRFLLTGYSEMDAIVEAINLGQVHRYLTKPWKDEELLLQVRQALEQFELVMENKRLLALTARQNIKLKDLNANLEEKVKERSLEIIKKNEQLSILNKELESSFHNTVRSFASLLQMQAPALAGHGRRVAALSRGIGVALELDRKEITHIEIAALLHDIGWLEFSGLSMDSPMQDWSEEDRERYQEHPEQGQAMVRFIGKLDHVGLLIRSHHEHCNGKGFPDGLDHYTIPLGSKVIAVADTYDRILRLQRTHSPEVLQYVRNCPDSKGLKQEFVVEKAALQHIKENSKVLFDPQVVKAFMKHLDKEGITRSKEKLTDIGAISPGMVLSRSIYSKKGQFLLPYDTVLTQGYIERLKVIATEAGLGSVYILCE